MGMFEVFDIGFHGDDSLPRLAENTCSQLTL